MNKTLHFLLLEDVLTDAELIEYELRKGNFLFSLKRVTTEDAFLKALEKCRPDIILADYKLPLFDGISALRVAEKKCPDIPFIFVSGYRGEELAVETLKNGATDYILKDNLSRLVPSVLLAFNEREEQRKRKQAEEALQKSQERLKLAQEAARIGIFDWNIQTNEIVWTPELEVLYGLKPGEFGRKYENWKHAVHPQDRNRAEEDVLRSINEKKQLDTEFRILWPDKSIHWIAVKGNTFYDKCGKPLRMIGFSIDITERKCIEQELRDSKSQLETIFQTVADGIIVYDSNGKLLYANDIGAKLYGFSSAKEILEVSNLVAIWKRIYKHFEIKDEFGNPLLFDQIPTNRVRKGEPDPEAVICFKDKVTDSVSWVLIKSRPVFNGQGEVRMIVTVISNITERKEQEKRKDEFIITASHELKTPLTSLKAFTQFLEKLIDKNEDKKYKSYIVKIDKQADKLTKLVIDLLDISKIEAGKIEFHGESFDLNRWIREIAEDMQASAGKHRIIVKGKTTRNIYGDKDRLSQVITNLLSNAIKYSPEANKVVIKLSEDEDKATIAVQDFGIGIEEQYRDKIFERFFRINYEDEKIFPGLGLGLYISHQIIKRHGGQIWVENVKDSGSTLCFTIPFKASI